MKPDYGVLEVVGVKRVHTSRRNDATVTLNGGPGLIGRIVWTIPDALVDVEQGDKFEVQISPLTSNKRD